MSVAVLSSATVAAAVSSAAGALESLRIAGREILRGPLLLWIGPGTSAGFSQYVEGCVQGWKLAPCPIPGPWRLVQSGPDSVLLQGDATLSSPSPAVVAYSARVRYFASSSKLIASASLLNASDFDVVDVNLGWLADFDIGGQPVLLSCDFQTARLARRANGPLTVVDRIPSDSSNSDFFLQISGWQDRLVVGLPQESRNLVIRRHDADGSGSISLLWQRDSGTLSVLVSALPIRSSASSRALQAGEAQEASISISMESAG